jgi:hypothetical protein
MTNLNHLLFSQFRLHTVSDPEEVRRAELCLQLAENLHDLGATDFSRELSAGNDRYVIRVQRY